MVFPYQANFLLDWARTAQICSREVSGRLALHQEQVFLIPEVCDTTNHIRTTSSIVGYIQPLIMSHTFNIG